MLFVAIVGGLIAIPMLKVAAQSDSTWTKVIVAVLVSIVLLAGFGAFGGDMI